MNRMNRMNRLPIHLPVAAPSEIMKANSNLNSRFRFVGTTSTSTSTSTVRTSTTSTTQQQRGGNTNQYENHNGSDRVDDFIRLDVHRRHMKIIETEQQTTYMDMKHDSDHRESDMNNDNDNDNDNSNDNSNRILRSDIMNARKSYGAREV